jgi:hypothetical protein
MEKAFIRQEASEHMKKQRKHYTPEEKAAILRRHLVEGVPISVNSVRLNSAIVYITPKDILAGH